jgi:molybdopterin-guanine dinucleotide biosynthesis protein B
MPRLISMVGRKGSGKSQVLESLIARLTQKGFRVGVIKHLTRDDFEIDEPGKDTYGYRMQGASKVILSGRKRLALFANLEEEIPVERLLSHFQGFDLVFLEGFFLENIPTVEIYKECAGDLLTKNLKGVVGHYSAEEIFPLGEWIETHVLTNALKGVGSCRQ